MSHNRESLQTFRLDHQVFISSHVVRSEESRHRLPLHVPGPRPPTQKRRLQLLSLRNSLPPLYWSISCFNYMLYGMTIMMNTLTIARFDCWTWFAHSRWRYTALGFHWKIKIVGHENGVLIGTSPWTWSCVRVHRFRITLAWFLALSLGIFSRVSPFFAAFRVWLDSLNLGGCGVGFQSCVRYLVFPRLHAYPQDCKSLSFYFWLGCGRKKIQKQMYSNL